MDCLICLFGVRLCVFCLWCWSVFYVCVWVCFVCLFKCVCVVSWWRLVWFDCGLLDLGLIVNLSCFVVGAIYMLVFCVCFFFSVWVCVCEFWVSLGFILLLFGWCVSAFGDFATGCCAWGWCLLMFACFMIYCFVFALTWVEFVVLCISLLLLWLYLRRFIVGLRYLILFCIALL